MAATARFYPNPAEPLKLLSVIPGATLSPLAGGTGLTSYTTGDIVYASATNVLSTLGIGTPGQFIVSADGRPQWATFTGALTSDPLSQFAATTLAQLNGVISDATLIDTGDSRLSDARTPLSHNHAASEITSGELSIIRGGTSASTAQAAINALTAVSGATNEHVLTKDTSTGNAIFKAAAGGGITIDTTSITGGGANRLLLESATNKVTSTPNLLFQSSTDRAFIGSNTGWVTAVDDTVSPEPVSTALIISGDPPWLEFYDTGNTSGKRRMVMQYDNFALTFRSMREDGGGGQTATVTMDGDGNFTANNITAAGLTLTAGSIAIGEGQYFGFNLNTAYYPRYSNGVAVINVGGGGDRLDITEGSIATRAMRARFQTGNGNDTLKLYTDITNGSVQSLAVTSAGMLVLTPIASTTGLKIQANATAGTWIDCVTSGLANVFKVTLAKNVCIGLGAAGTSAVGVLAIGNGTQGAALTDAIQLVSEDLSAGNTIPSIRTEGSGIYSAGTPAAATGSIAIKINGTVYHLTASTTAAS